MAVLSNQAQTLLTGLSDFWQRFFADRDILNGLYAATEVQLGQAYLDMVTQVLNANLDDVPLFNKEYWYLLTVRQDQVRYDLESQTWNLALDDKLREAMFLLNRVYDPTVSLEVDIDFDIDADADELRFFADPFNTTNGVASREIDIVPTVFRNAGDGKVTPTADVFVTRGVVRSGTDGTFPASNSFVSARAAFTADDVGRVLSHPDSGATLEREILGVVDARTVVLDGSYVSAATGVRWEVRDTEYFTQFDVGTQILFVDPTRQDRELLYTIETVDSGLQVTFTEETVFDPVDDDTLQWTHQSPSRVTQLSYWIPDALFDRENLWLSFGYLLNRYEPSTESYRALLQGIFRYFILGPSLRRIESALNVISGIPVARQDGEVIASTTTGGAADIVVTDIEVYRLPAGSIDPALSVGDTLEAFQPLSIVFEVDDYISNPTWYYTEVIPDELWPGETAQRRSVDTTLYENRVGNPRFKVGDLFYTVGGDSYGTVPARRTGKSLFYNLSVTAQLEVVGDVVRTSDETKTITIAGTEYEIVSAVDRDNFSITDGTSSPLDISGFLASNYSFKLSVVTLGSNEFVITFGPSFTRADIGTVIRVVSASAIPTGDYVVTGVLASNRVLVDNLDGTTPSFFLEPSATGLVGAEWAIEGRPALTHSPGYNYMSRLLKNHIFNVSYDFAAYPDIEFPRAQRDIRDVLLEGRSAYTYLLVDAAGQFQDEVGVGDDELLIVGKPDLDAELMSEVDSAFEVGGGTEIGTYYTYSGPQLAWYTTVRKDDFGTVTELPDSGEVETLVFMYQESGGVDPRAQVELYAWAGASFVATGEMFTLAPGTNQKAVLTHGRLLAAKVTSFNTGATVEGVSVGYIAGTPSVLQRVAPTFGGSVNIVGDTATFDVELNQFDFRHEVVIKVQGTPRRFRIVDVSSGGVATLVGVVTGAAPALTSETGVEYYFSAPRTSFTHTAVGGANPVVEKTSSGNYITSWPVLVTLQSTNNQVFLLGYFASTVQPTLGSANIVAHYRFDETSGTTATDASGNGNDGTFENGVTLGAPSLIASGGGTAVDLDGVNDYVDLGAKSRTNFIHETGVFAVGGWIDFTDAGDNQVVFSTGGLVAGTGVVVLLQQVFGTSRGVVSFRGGANTVVRSGASTPADGVRHIFITGDGNNIYLYVDAVLLGYGAITTVAGDSALTPRIGDASGSRFEGRVDEWTIANVHATAADVLALYNGGT